jgi:hypothetical protein
MSKRRIACRVVSVTWHQTPCMGAMRARTLATKVFHYPCRLFMRGRGQQSVGDAEPWLVAQLASGGWSLAGVRLLCERTAACRVACPATLVVTPYVNTSLVTKEKKRGVE